jgi:hypothetical protein
MAEPASAFSMAEPACGLWWRRDTRQPSIVLSVAIDRVVPLIFSKSKAKFADVTGVDEVVEFLKSH